MVSLDVTSVYCGRGLCFFSSSRQECKKSCPVVKMGKLCIEVGPNDKKAFLSEELCIGCGICVKK